MDRDGNYTDRRGRPLRVGDRVLIIGAGFPPAGGATVRSLPPANSDWHGFPYVECDSDGKCRHVSESHLQLADYRDPRTAPLENMLDAAKAHNAAMRSFLERTRHDG